MITMTANRSIAPLSARRKMLDEPGLGAGTFLQYALAYNPNPFNRFLYRDYRGQHGQVELYGYSLRDLESIRDRYAQWYWGNGVRPGQPVGIYVAEGLEPFFQYLGLTALGAIPAMINDAMPSTIVRRYLEHIGAVGLVTENPKTVTAALGAIGRQHLRFIVSVEELAAHDSHSSELPSRYPYSHAPDDVVALIHSSGTTGAPKATMVGHHQFWVGRKNRVLQFPSEPYDRLLSSLPHTHAAGISYLMNSVLIGLPTVAMSNWRRQAVEPVMNTFQPTVVVSFPRTYVELASGELPVEGAARVHTWISTGDRAHNAHVQRLVQLGQRPAGTAGQYARQGSQFIDGLGSSELGMSLFQQITTPESTRDDCCIGKPIDIVEKAAVLDQNGQELPDGTAGFLGVRTPTCTAGYWNAPELTRRHRLAGYWLSGDMVRKDNKGRFYHLDRDVDVIPTSAGRVHSLPLEEVLLADCAKLILDCAIVGAPDATGSGQCPVAVVVLQVSAEEPPPQYLLQQLNNALTAAKLTPLAAVVVARNETQFPTGATGKVLKRELRNQLATLLTHAADRSQLVDK
jgi:acyl-coenzyme A synthetase/AMP-(fatty) acid ligase